MKRQNRFNELLCVISLVAIGALAWAGSSQAETIIYQDDFNRGTIEVPVDLNGAAPVITSDSYGGTLGATWTAVTGEWVMNGAGAVLTKNDSNFASLPFSPLASSVYQLDWTWTQPSEGHWWEVILSPSGDFPWGTVGPTPDNVNNGIEGVNTLSAVITTDSTTGYSCVATFNGITAAPVTGLTAGITAVGFITQAGAAGATMQSMSLIVPGGSDILPTATALSIAAGSALDLNGVSQQIASLADHEGTGGSVINSNVATASTLILSPASGSTTFSGAIVGGESYGKIDLVKTGSGTQILSSANTYTGDTTVEAGTLSITLLDSLDDASTVRIFNNDTALLDLAFDGMDKIAALYLGSGDDPMHDGVYGASNYPSYFTGTGKLQVGDLLPGDTNDDGVVDAADYIAIKTNFGAGPDATRLMGDLSGDGYVNWADLQELMDQFGTRSVGGAPAAPEPATLPDVHRDRRVGGPPSASKILSAVEGPQSIIDRAPGWKYECRIPKS